MVDVRIALILNRFMFASIMEFDVRILINEHVTTASFQEKQLSQWLYHQ